MTTLRGRADKWWRAHLAARPSLVVSFPQLTEWVRAELVPDAMPSASILAWKKLVSNGNLEDYLKEVERLSMYYPVEPLVSHALACEPLGEALVHQVQALDRAKGGDGIPFDQLKLQIRSFHALNAYLEGKKPGAIFARPAAAHSVQVSETRVAAKAHDTSGSGAGEKCFRCWVCGTMGHTWHRCPNRFLKGCPACGSLAHRIQTCAQRKGRPQWDQPLSKTKIPIEKGVAANSMSSEIQPRSFLRGIAPESSPTMPTSHVCHVTATTERAVPLGTVTAETTVLSGVQTDGKRRGYYERFPSLNSAAASLRSNSLFDAMIEAVPEMSGLPPASPPALCGRLEYSIMVQGRTTNALLDHRATHLFMDARWAQEQNFELSKLTRPLRLIEFSGKSTSAEWGLKEACVCFAGKKRRWSFVITPSAPAAVVLGLDFIRAWHLCYNPANDHVVLLSPRDPRVLSTTFVLDFDDEDQECMSTDVGSSEGSDSERNEEGTFVVARDVHEIGRRQRKRQWQWEPRKGRVGFFVHSSVTASSWEEQQKVAEFVDCLDPRLITLAKQHSSLFKPPDAIPPARSVTHRIRLRDDVFPAKRAPYPVGIEKARVMQEQISDLADKGWIVPSSSAWAAPILFVKKKEGTWRLCTDFRDLNALSLDDCFPLPRIETLLHRAGDASVFSKIDLASGFHQIAIDEGTKEMTAFGLPLPVKGHTLWHWTVMPFGLKNAPPTFQRAMTVALHGCEAFAVVYIDDILVFSHNEEEHLKHLAAVFARLEQHGYHVRIHKCELMKLEVEFLGHRLSAKGMTPSFPKVEALNAWQSPLRSAKEVRQFMGLALWYKAFIPHLASIAAPLFQLTSTKKQFLWTTAAAQAMETIKTLVRQAPCLARWEPERPTRVLTDASKVGIGAALEQQYGVNWRPVAFWSRKLRDAETRYSTTDREWLAVVEAVSRRWRFFLEDRLSRCAPITLRCLGSS